MEAELGRGAEAASCQYPLQETSLQVLVVRAQASGSGQRARKGPAGEGVAACGPGLSVKFRVCGDEGSRASG